MNEELVIDLLNQSSDNNDPNSSIQNPYSPENTFPPHSSSPSPTLKPSSSNYIGDSDALQKNNDAYVYNNDAFDSSALREKSERWRLGSVEEKTNHRYVFSGIVFNFIILNQYVI
ncbi:unnamed protein product [Vicia faba]|uniref:Uncharacterized protein n=1 Tax=Vicia faba TaxID=3906 RepID=A0AAV0YZM0_VICFA|nr:unnamed protein product [Vicia faba]